MPRGLPALSSLSLPLLFLPGGSERVCLPNGSATGQGAEDPLLGVQCREDFPQGQRSGQVAPGGWEARSLVLREHVFLLVLLSTRHHWLFLGKSSCQVTAGGSQMGGVGSTGSLQGPRCRMGPTNRGSTGCDLSRLEDVVEHVPSRLENGGLPGPFPRVTLGAHFGRRDTGPDGADRRDPTGHRLDAT